MCNTYSCILYCHIELKIKIWKLIVVNALHTVRFMQLDWAQAEFGHRLNLGTGWIFQNMSNLEIMNNLELQTFKTWFSEPSRAKKAKNKTWFSEPSGAKKSQKNLIFFINRAGADRCSQNFGFPYVFTIKIYQNFSLCWYLVVFGRKGLSKFTT